LLLVFGWRGWQRWATTASRPSALSNHSLSTQCNDSLLLNGSAEQDGEKAAQVDREQGPWLAVVAGLALGLAGGLFSAAGPVFMVFALVAQVSKDETRATLRFISVFFLCPIRMLVLLFVGAVDLESIGWRGLIALPGGIVGLAIGNYVTRFLSKAAWQQVILVILLGSSLSFLLAPVVSG